MSKISREEAESRKKAIFTSLSSRGRKYIDRIGYDNWDPFEEPKDPIDIRRDVTKRTTQQLVRAFLQARPPEASYSNAYGQAVMEMCIGIVNNDERYQAMLDFANWYNEQLKLGKRDPS
ncbi:MAG: hypothetical protein JJV98_07015 [Desulfosarcina sp.]|nr:hypothetical protein [Desulfobacterales bacterium]